MNIDIKVALIAGSISFVVSLLGFMSSWLALSGKREELERTIQNQFTGKLYALRLEHYPQAFVITEKIQRRPKPQQLIEHAELQKIANELYNWKTGIVSLIISKSSLKAFWSLRDVLEMDYGDNDRFTDSQVEKIMKMRNEFRNSLREDIGFLYEEDELKD